MFHRNNHKPKLLSRLIARIGNLSAPRRVTRPFTASIALR